MDGRTKFCVPLCAVILVAFTLLFLAGCNGDKTDRWGAGNINKDSYEPIALTYLGQAAFLFEYGVKVLMDPYSPEMGYGKLEYDVDLVTISHNHFDHNYVAGGGPQAVVLYGVDEDGNCNEILHSFAGLNIYTIPGSHDQFQGSWLGNNSIFVIESYELRLAHLGDLGHPLRDEELEALGAIDILLIPVGGHYTMGLQEVLQSIEALSPAVVVPMHYRTEHFPERMLGTLEEFLQMKLPYPLVEKGRRIEVTKDELPRSTEIWVMDYRNK